MQNTLPWKSYLLTLGLFLAVAGTPAMGQNQDNISEEEMQRRENAATQTISESTRLSREYGYWNAAAQQNFYGPEGSHTLAKKYFGMLRQWTENWQIITAAIQITELVDFDRIYAALTERLERQNTLLQEIESILPRIEQSRQKGIKGLDRASEIPYAFLNRDGADVIETLKQQSKILRASLEAIGQSVEVSFKGIPELHQASLDIIGARLKQQLLQLGIAEIDPRLTQSRDLITYHQYIKPLLGHISRSAQNAESYSLNFAVFSARAAAKEGASQCDAAGELLDRLILSQASKSSYEQQLSRICGEISHHGSILTHLGVGDAEAVYEHGQMQTAKLRPHCESNSSNFQRESDQMQSNINCEQFGLLANIKLEKLKSMESAKLKEIEQQWLDLAKINN